MRAVAILLGLAFAVVAIVYWTMPAGSLPSFLPGFEAGSTLMHVKHGIAAAAVAVLCFGFGWYTGRSRA
jgi:cytochrome b